MIYTEDQDDEALMKVCDNHGDTDHHKYATRNRTKITVVPKRTPLSQNSTTTNADASGNLKKGVHARSSFKKSSVFGRRRQETQERTESSRTPSSSSVTRCNSARRRRARSTSDRSSTVISNTSSSSTQRRRPTDDVRRGTGSGKGSREDTPVGASRSPAEGDM